MIWSVAHGDQVHENTFDEVMHALTVHPIIGTAILLVIMATVISLAYMFSGNSIKVAILTTLTLLFIVGFVFYSILPALSVIAIALGFTFSLAIVLGGLK